MYKLLAVLLVICLTPILPLLITAETDGAITPWMVWVVFFLGFLTWLFFRRKKKRGGQLSEKVNEAFDDFDGFDDDEDDFDPAEWDEVANIRVTTDADGVHAELVTPQAKAKRSKPTKSRSKSTSTKSRYQIDAEQGISNTSHNRIQDRLVDEMIGLCNGIVADGVVSQAEAEFLQKWMVANQRVINNPVIEPLYRRLNDMLVDDVLDADEAKELLDTLTHFTASDYELGEVAQSSRLPLDANPTDLTIKGKLFCLTGTFAFGAKKKCEAFIIENGGSTHPRVIKKVDFLVVGRYATDEWKHSTYGKKIELAARYREEGTGIQIIGEDLVFG